MVQPCHSTDLIRHTCRRWLEVRLDRASRIAVAAHIGQVPFLLKGNSGRARRPSLAALVLLCFPLGPGVAARQRALEQFDKAPSWKPPGLTDLGFGLFELIMALIQWLSLCSFSVQNTCSWTYGC